MGTRADFHVERDNEDALWREDKERNGWKLPPPAPWLLRLPVLRTIRGAWNLYHAEKNADQWASVGIGLGSMNPYDRWIIYAIYRGWC